MGFSYTYMWQIKIEKDISGTKNPSPTTGLPTRASSVKQRSHITSGCKDLVNWGFGRQKLLESLEVHLKELTHSLIQTHSLWAPEQESQIEILKDIQGNLNCLASRQELGSSFLLDSVLAEATVPFLSPPPTEPQSQQPGTIWETQPIWLTRFAALKIPWGPVLHSFWANPTRFQRLFHMNGLSWSMLQIFLSSFKQAACLGTSVSPQTLAK